MFTFVFEINVNGTFKYFRKIFATSPSKNIKFLFQNTRDCAKVPTGDH